MGVMLGVSRERMGSRGGESLLVDKEDSNSSNRAARVVGVVVAVVEEVEIVLCSGISRRLGEGTEYSRLRLKGREACRRRNRWESTSYNTSWKEMLDLVFRWLGSDMIDMSKGVSRDITDEKGSVMRRWSYKIDGNVNVCSAFDG